MRSTASREVVNKASVNCEQGRKQRGSHQVVTASGGWREGEAHPPVARRAKLVQAPDIGSPAGTKRASRNTGKYQTRVKRESQCGHCRMSQPGQPTRGAADTSLNGSWL